MLIAAVLVVGSAARGTWGDALPHVRPPRVADRGVFEHLPPRGVGELCGKSPCTGVRGSVSRSTREARARARARATGAGAQGPGVRGRGGVQQGR